MSVRCDAEGGRQYPAERGEVVVGVVGVVVSRRGKNPREYGARRGEPAPQVFQGSIPLRLGWVGTGRRAGGLGGSSNESRLDSSVLVAAKMKEKKEGRATVHWAMNGMSLASSFLDCILPASHLCKGSRPRSTTLDFGHAAAMQFLGGQALPFRWFLCELERVRSRAREGPRAPLFSSSVFHTFNKTRQRGPQKIRQSDPTVGKQDDAPDPGPSTPPDLDPSRRSIRRPWPVRPLLARQSWAIGVAR